ncbi:MULTISPECIES: MipA/OmpV family protein [unclassified Caballeronia]|uniref:MipA/OmpV family protein n=1 Tax=unclassified Caballeronia TaxID=2646786 RepID=UPI00285569BA|nr:MULTISPECIES: MipA/OmpV family protein [unclassified Caballeronia]MDR5823734.1 MipA/OmpV family protein [Caballeronia sp. LZ043]MDR5881631.1 MipA/OmpV family protein [Caballeronia sp. LZ032]
MITPTVFRPAHLAWLALVMTASAAADEAPPPSKPLWEVGVGAGVAAFPHYPGSDQTRAWVFPFPYIVYRGKYLRADRDGVRGQLLDTDRVNFNISVLGSLPVSSRDDNARAGMPDLKPTIEVGPSVEVHLWRSASRDMQLDLRMPVRLGITLESSPKTVGWQFTPNLNLDFTDVGHVSGLHAAVFAGPMFADSKYSDHYYTVAPQYATAARPAFHASGGYAGSQALVSMSRRFSRYWVGAFVRYANLAGAHFDDSPLVRQKSVLSGGIAVAWVFGQSSKMVASDE